MARWASFSVAAGSDQKSHFPTSTPVTTMTKAKSVSMKGEMPDAWADISLVRWGICEVTSGATCEVTASDVAVVCCIRCLRPSSWNSRWHHVLGTCPSGLHTQQRRRCPTHGGHSP